MNEKKNDTKLERMLQDMEKIYKEKNHALQKRGKRKLRMRDKKSNLKA